MKPRLDLLTVLACLGALLFWSSSYAAIRYALGSFQPGEVALLRFSVAGVCFAPAFALKKIRLPPKADWPKVVALGLIGISIYQLALGYAEERVSPNTAAIVIALVPGVTAALAAFRLNERFSASGWAGLAVAFLGAVLTVLGNGRTLQFEPAALLLLICLFGTSIYQVWQKPLFTRMRPLDFTAASLICGAVGLMPFGYGLPAHLAAARPEHIAAIVYLGICPSALSFLLWNWALSRAPAGSVATFFYLSPVIAALVSWVWLGEGVTPLACVGGGLAIGGVVLVQRGDAIANALRRRASTPQVEGRKA